MGLATVASRAQNGLEATAVAVEVHVAGGLPGMTIVGLPEAAVRESKDRVRAALVNAGFQMPPSRITVNLAPADLPKEGGRFDLAIAIGILAASGQIDDARLGDCELLGELSLSAELRPIRGALPSSVHAGRAGKTLILPQDNAAEAALAGQTVVRAAGHLLEVCGWLAGQTDLQSATPPAQSTAVQPMPDLQDVLGQHQGRRALLRHVPAPPSVVYLKPGIVHDGLDFAGSVIRLDRDAASIPECHLACARMACLPRSLRSSSQCRSPTSFGHFCCIRAPSFRTARRHAATQPLR